MGQENFVLKLVIILAGYSSVLLPFYCLIRFVQRRCKENDMLFSYSSAWWAQLLRNFAVGHPEYLPLNAKRSNELDGGNSRKPTTASLPDSLRSSLRDERGEGVLLAEPPRGRKIQTGPTQHTITKSHKDNLVRDCCRLFVYFSGIQITLVSMGFFQERIITQGYLLVENPLVVEKFDDAQFLVFVNRIFGFFLAGAYLLYDWKRQPIHIPPLYAHSITSISNTISSWCQYEALKYVSFLTQTVCKASKVIPTMLMGRLIRKERYPKAQYALALLLVTGASIFFLSMTGHHAVKEHHRNRQRADDGGGGGVGRGDDDGGDGDEDVSSALTTLSGLVLMACYLALDAFTPNYQKKLMEARVSRWQMMFYVNFFSAFLCLVSLLQQWSFFDSLSFILTHYDILRDCCLLSLGSACGQIFIYSTIEEFGPVVLSVLMTLRQIFSIILSAVHFSHPVSATGVAGLALVFGAILADTYRKYFYRKVAVTGRQP